MNLWECVFFDSAAILPDICQEGKSRTFYAFGLT